MTRDALIAIALAILFGALAAGVVILIADALVLAPPPDVGPAVNVSG